MSDTLAGGGPPRPMPPAGSPQAGGMGLPPGGLSGMPGAGAPPPGFPRPSPNPNMPGAGTQAGALIKMQHAIAMLQQALADLPIGSDMHKAALKAISDLAKHAGGGPETQGVQQTGAGNMLMNIVRNALMQRVAGNQGGAPTGIPSTPLPGA
jgi:hypothetical protein